MSPPPPPPPRRAPPAVGRRPPTSEEASMQAYLRTLNLQDLELDDIALDREPGIRWGRWLQLALLVAIGGFLLWFPSTVAYQLHSQSVWVFGGLSLLAVGLGFSLSGWLWTGARLALLAAARLQAQAPPRLGLSPAALRWLFLGGAAGLLALLAFVLPQEAEWQGAGYSGGWFTAVGAAVVTGIFLGRWLILQAAASGPAAPRRPWVLPPWFKWVSLGGLVLGGLVAAFGHLVVGGESESARFGLGGCGFVVGIGAAIWLARRFDEMEVAGRAAAAARRASAAAEATKSTTIAGD